MYKIKFIDSFGKEQFLKRMKRFSGGYFYEYDFKTVSKSYARKVLNDINNNSCIDIDVAMIVKV